MLAVATALAAPLISALQGIFVEAGPKLAMIALLPLLVLLLAFALCLRSGLRLARRAMVAAGLALAGYALLPPLAGGMENLQQALACLPAAC